MSAPPPLVAPVSTEVHAYLDPIPVILPHRSICTLSGASGVGKCLANGELLRLADGRQVPIESLHGQTFMVLSLVPDGNGEVVSTLAGAWDNGLEPVVEIRTISGRLIRRTLNHPLWGDGAPRRGWHRSVRRLDPQGSWISAGDVRPGAVLALAEGHAPPDTADVTDDEIKLAAYLVADGGTSGTDVRFTQQTGAVLTELREIVDRLHCFLNQQSPYDFRIQKKQHPRNPRVKNPILERVRLWQMAGCTAHTKDVPTWAWQLGAARLALFLSRLYACDGWATTHPERGGRTRREIGYTSVNPILARSVQTLLLRLGIVADWRQKSTTWTHKGTRRHGVAYTVAIRDVVNLRRFIQAVGIFGKDAAVAAINDTLENLQGIPEWIRLGLPDGFVWDRVKSVRSCPPEPTTAIHVPGSQTFLTDFVEHNTALLASWIERLQRGATIHHHATNRPTDIGVLVCDRPWRDHEQWFARAGCQPLKRLSLRDDPGFDWNIFRRQQDVPVLFDQLVRKLALAPGALLIVDPLPLFIPGRLNDYKDMAIGMGQLDKIIQAHQITMLGIFHVAKQKANKQDQYLRPQDRLLGSGAQVGYSETTMYLLAPEETDGSSHAFGWVPHQAKEEVFRMTRDERGLFIPYMHLEDVSNIEQALLSLPISATPIDIRNVLDLIIRRCSCTERSAKRYLVHLVNDGRVRKVTRGYYQRMEPS